MSKKRRKKAGKSKSSLGLADAVIYCDGACEPVNPGGTAAYGWVLFMNGEETARGRGVVGRGPGMTNNVAEYGGAIAALEYLAQTGYTGPVEVRSDSQLLINQASGIWQVHSERIRKLHTRLSRLCAGFKRVRFTWVPRRKNEEADRLSVEAVTEFEEGRTFSRARGLVDGVREAAPGVYLVRSSRGKKDYRVDWDAQTCTCPVYKKQDGRVRVRCKHLLAVEIYRAEPRNESSNPSALKKMQGGLHNAY